MVRFVSSSTMLSNVLGRYFSTQGVGESKDDDGADGGDDTDVIDIH
jgi:hypothetical protein